MITFIIGGIKSGKTKFALKKAQNTGSKNLYYIATARAIDDE
ncbi:MAG: bifunctional adenosylcobinamide kinase/adenosylcobinamide-phosphate guanylyltransferase, partial [Thermodesulfovibrio sp.]